MEKRFILKIILFLVFFTSCNKQGKTAPNYNTAIFENKDFKVVLDSFILNTKIYSAQEYEEILISLYRRNKDTDRKSTRLNSSHVRISYAVFCLKKKNNNKKHYNII